MMTLESSANDARNFGITFTIIIDNTSLGYYTFIAQASFIHDDNHMMIIIDLKYRPQVTLK